MKLFLRLSTAFALAATGVVVAAACGSTAGPALGITYTDVYVDPSTFRGAVACGDGVGTMRSYVVTLFDVTPLVADGGAPTGSAGSAGAPSGGTGGGGGAAGAGAMIGPLACGWPAAPPFTQLPSSAPTSCTLRSLSGDVVPGGAYVAAIDAYALPPCDSGHVSGCIRPLALGSPIMVDDAGERVAPLAATCCGTTDLPAGANLDGGVIALTNGPTVAIAVAQVPLRGCAPFGATATARSVVVRTGALVGALGCAAPAGNGKVARVTVSATGNAAADVACGADVALDASPGSDLAISVYAYAPQAAAPTWGTTCYATPVSGAAVEAACDPLSTTGGLRVASTVALGALGATCSGGVATLVATSAGGVVTVACGATLSIPNLLPGVQSVKIEAKSADGAVVKTTTCSATVTPGHFADATCSSGV